MEVSANKKDVSAKKDWRFGQNIFKDFTES